jgi:hypothetical protein
MQRARGTCPERRSRVIASALDDWQQTPARDDREVPRPTTRSRLLRPGVSERVPGRSGYDWPGRCCPWDGCDGEARSSVVLLEAQVQSDTDTRGLG